MKYIILQCHMFKTVRKPESIEKLGHETFNITMGFPPEIYLDKDIFCNDVRVLKQILFQSQTIEGFNVTKYRAHNNGLVGVKNLSKKGSKVVRV